MVCDEVQASFNAPTPHLQPLRIMGLGYRWSLDFVDPWVWHFDIINMFWLWLNISLFGWSWFHCWIEVATYAFLTWYLVSLGLHPKFSLTKVHNSMGNSKSCVRKHWLIICLTSQDHLKGNGLAEQMVQMVKWGLRKYGLHKGHNQDWDLNYHG